MNILAVQWISSKLLDKKLLLPTISVPVLQIG